MIVIDVCVLVSVCLNQFIIDEPRTILENYIKRLVQVLLNQKRQKNIQEFIHALILPTQQKLQPQPLFLSANAQSINQPINQSTNHRRPIIQTSTQSITRNRVGRRVGTRAPGPPPACRP